MLDLNAFRGRKLNCAGIGEVLYDVFDDGPRIGGAPANFAYHCRMQGLNAMAISGVGDDDLGHLAHKLFDEKQLPYYLETVARPTGQVRVSLDESGVPTYTFLMDTAYDNMEADEKLLNIARKTQVCCFGSLAQRSAKSAAAILAFLKAMPEELRLRVYDVNLRRDYFSREVVESSLSECEIFKCNDEELPVLMKLLEVKGQDERDFNAYLRSRGVYGFIYTCGADSSTVFLNDEVSHLKTPKVKAVSTVGAGDSFTATVITSLLKGYPLTKAHSLANTVAAYVCTVDGAMPEYPEALKAQL